MRMKIEAEERERRTKIELEKERLAAEEREVFAILYKPLKMDKFVGSHKEILMWLEIRHKMYKIRIKETRALFKHEIFWSTFGL